MEAPLRVAMEVPYGSRGGLVRYLWRPRLPRLSPVAREKSYIDRGSTDQVSLSGLLVLTILYKLILMHKKNKCQNCEFCVL